MTIDEELTLLDTQLRRLKIEYEIYFSNPTKRPPTDVEWKVLSLLRKFSDGTRMSFSQRFRYNEIAQRYAIYSDLWRKKARIREEGYRRAQDQVTTYLSDKDFKPLAGMLQERLASLDPKKAIAFVSQNKKYTEWDTRHPKSSPSPWNGRMLTPNTIW